MLHTLHTLYILYILYICCICCVYAVYTVHAVCVAILFFSQKIFLREYFLQKSIFHILQKLWKCFAKMLHTLHTLYILYILYICCICCVYAVYTVYAVCVAILLFSQKYFAGIFSQKSIFYILQKMWKCFFGNMGLDP